MKKHGRAPKIQAVLDLIDQMKPDEKGVIFSQWTSTLDLLEEEFKALGHTFTRIGKNRGTSTVADRKGRLTVLALLIVSQTVEHKSCQGGYSQYVKHRIMPEGP